MVYHGKQLNTGKCVTVKNYGFNSQCLGLNVIKVGRYVGYNRVEVYVFVSIFRQYQLAGRYSALILYIVKTSPHGRNHKYWRLCCYYGKQFCIDRCLLMLENCSRNIKKQVNIIAVFTNTVLYCNVPIFRYYEITGENIIKKYDLACKISVIKLCFKIFKAIQYRPVLSIYLRSQI